MGFRLDQYASKPAATRPFQFRQIIVDGEPATLTVKHAGESNAEFNNAAFKLLRVRSDAGSGAQALTPARLKEARLEAAGLYSKYVVTGWAHMPPDDGKPATFTPDACLRFLTELIEVLPEAFDALRSFCGNPDNFRDPVVDPVDLGKG